MHLKHWADRALVETFLLTRDETVFRWLYQRYSDRLWRLALRLSAGNRILAEEWTQEAWMRAVERMPDFRWESSLPTWLSGFVVRVAQETWRRQTVENERSLPFEVALFETETPVWLHEKMDMETAFSMLPPGFRAVLTLYDAEGYKHEEIAEMLGISVGTSKSQLSRARAALRDFLNESPKT
ncbi:MAG: RNA polymerase sigma factor [Saprospiraceae bacterium]|nr:RNA polymerase sigma factor [Saprospiraceae bacterium]